MYFRFRPKGSLDPQHWRYYRAPRWYDARAAAVAHFPATEELEWYEVSKALWDAMVEDEAPPRWVYDVTWTGHDAGAVPTRAMHVIELRRRPR